MSLTVAGLPDEMLLSEEDSIWRDKLLQLGWTPEQTLKEEKSLKQVFQENGLVLDPNDCISKVRPLSSNKFVCEDRTGGWYTLRSTNSFRQGTARFGVRITRSADEYAHKRNDTNRTQASVGVAESARIPINNSKSGCVSNSHCCVYNFCNHRIYHPAFQSNAPVSEFAKQVDDSAGRFYGFEISFGDQIQFQVYMLGREIIDYSFERQPTDYYIVVDICDAGDVMEFFPVYSHKQLLAMTLSENVRHENDNLDQYLQAAV